MVYHLSNGAMINRNPYEDDEIEDYNPQDHMEDLYSKEPIQEDNIWFILIVVILMLCTPLGWIFPAIAICYGLIKLLISALKQ